MCSLTESELEPELVKASTNLKPHQIPICKKCKQNKPCVNLRVNDVYCKDCFLKGVHHKFRSTLGKHKAMKPGDQVCVAYSGGCSSSALVHLLKMGTESDHKKLLFVPNILYVDDGCLFQLTPDERLSNIRAKVMELRYAGFPINVSLLETPHSVTSFQHPLQEEEIHTTISEKLGWDLQKCIDNIKENSAKEDFINTTRRRAIVEGAVQINCTKIFTGESSTKVSIDFLAGISMGKGINLAHETGFRDMRDPIVILRPLRDVSGKELALYARFHKLQFESPPNIATGKSSLFSIRKLTEDFLVGLQNDFPATLSTVFRTGDKLQAEEVALNEACVLCKGPIDTNTEEHCAMQATCWSLLVSSRGKQLGEDLLSNLNELDIDSLKKKHPVSQSSGKKLTVTSCSRDDKSVTACEQDSRSSQEDDITEKCCGQGDGSCRSSTAAVKPLVLEDLLQYVCYSCMRTLANCRSLDSLPSQLLKDFQQARNRRDMKEQIQDFLL